MTEKGKYLLGEYGFREEGKQLVPYWKYANGGNVYACSVCKNEAYWDRDGEQQLFRYCPYCGSRMVDFEERKEDDEKYKRYIRSVLGVRRKGV